MAGSLSRSAAALRSRDFRYLLASRLVSQLGDGFFQAYLIAELVFLDPERQGTAVGVAKAFAVLVIPFSILGPFSGVLIDRWSRRRILLATPVVRLAAAAFLLSASGAGLPLYALALVVVSANRFFLTTAAAVTPRVVRSDELLVANSMATVGGTVITFAGLFVATQMGDETETAAILAASAATWALSAMLASLIHNSLRAEHPTGSVIADLSRVRHELASGVRRLRATPPALGSIASVSFDQFLVGLVTVLGVVVFKERLNEGLASYGRLLGAGGLGVLAGTLTVGMLESRVAKPVIVSLAFAIAGIACLAAAAGPDGPVLLGMSFAIGLTFAWRKIPADTIVQQSIPDRFRGRVFAVYDITYSMARVVAAVVAVLLLPRVSTGWLLALIGCGYLLWSPVFPWWIRRPRWVDIRFYAGGRAEEVPRAIVTAGEEESVALVRSWNEERTGRQLQRLRLRTAGGTVVDVVSEPSHDRWRVEREVPSPEAAPS